MSPTSCQTAPPRACRNETASIEKRNYSKARRTASTLTRHIKQAIAPRNEYSQCFQATGAIDSVCSKWVITTAMQHGRQSCSFIKQQCADKLATIRPQR